MDSKFWTHAKTFLKYLQLQERQIFRKFEFYPASTFAKIQIQIQIQKKTLPYKNLITPMLPLSLLFLPLSWLNFQFYFQKTSLYFALYNLNYCSRLSVIGLISYPIGILYLAPVMLCLSTTHEAISVEKRMPLDDWRHQWFAIA